MKLITDMTSRPSDDCYKTGEPGDDRVRTCNRSDELMTNIPDNESEVDDVDDHHDIGRYLNDHRGHMSLLMRKLVFGVFDQVRHKPGCTVSENG